MRVPVVPIPIWPYTFAPQQAMEPSPRAAQLALPESSCVNPFVVGLMRTGRTRTTLVPSPENEPQHHSVPPSFNTQLPAWRLLTDATPEERSVTCRGIWPTAPAPAPSWP